MNRLVYFEQLGDINEAIAREKEIKLLTRKRKIKLIESITPHWKDLSQEWDEQAPESRIPRAPDTRANDKRGKGRGNPSQTDPRRSRRPLSNCPISG